jgi:hypothetical protein
MSESGDCFTFKNVEEDHKAVEELDGRLVRARTADLHRFNFEGELADDEKE